MNSQIFKIVAVLSLLFAVIVITTYLYDHIKQKSRKRKTELDYLMRFVDHVARVPMPNGGFYINQYGDIFKNRKFITVVNDDGSRVIKLAGYCFFENIVKTSNYVHAHAKDCVSSSILLDYPDDVISEYISRLEKIRKELIEFRIDITLSNNSAIGDKAYLYNRFAGSSNLLYAISNFQYVNGKKYSSIHCCIKILEEIIDRKMIADQNLVNFYNNIFKKENVVPFLKKEQLREIFKKHLPGLIDGNQPLTFTAGQIVELADPNKYLEDKGSKYVFCKYFSEIEYSSEPNTSPLDCLLSSEEKGYFKASSGDYRLAITEKTMSDNTLEI